MHCLGETNEGRNPISKSNPHACHFLLPALADTITPVNIIEIQKYRQVPKLMPVLIFLSKRHINFESVLAICLGKNGDFDQEDN